MFYVEPGNICRLILAISPVYVGGLEFGMLVGLLTDAPYATIDRPGVTNFLVLDGHRDYRGYFLRRYPFILPAHISLFKLYWL